MHASSSLRLKKPCAPALSLLEVCLYPVNNPRLACLRMRDQKIRTRPQGGERTQLRSAELPSGPIEL